MDYSNLLGGLSVQSQIPLDVKEYSTSELILSSLGVNNQLAYKYTQGLIVYCIQEESRWEWREVKAGEENIGLLIIDFIYPNGIIAFGIDYSNKSYSFFPYLITGNIGPIGPQGIPGNNSNIPGPQGPKGNPGVSTNGVDGIDGLNGLSAYEIALGEGYVGSETNWLLTLKGPQGTQGIQGITGNNGLDAANNLQKIVSSNYTIVNGDNNYSILINNGVNDINISIPNNLSTNINIGFIQQGSGVISFQHIGTGIIYTPTGYKIKGINYNCYLEQIGSTNNYHLLGNLKI